MNQRWLFVLVALLSGNSGAETLGRLFFTPEQRAAADRQRNAASPGATKRLDGLLTSSSGKATRWINGEAEHGNTPGLTGDMRQRAALAAADGTVVHLRVGESLDTANREKLDVLASGSIRKSR